MALLFYFLQQLNGSQCQILLLFYFILLRKHCRYGCAFHMELWMHGIHVFFFIIIIIITRLLKECLFFRKSTEITWTFELNKKQHVVTFTLFFL